MEEEKKYKMSKIQLFMYIIIFLILIAYLFKIV